MCTETKTLNLLSKELTPAELEQVLDDAHFVLSQFLINNPDFGAQGKFSNSEVLYYLHKLKLQINAC
jgi:hypothetical protein